MLNNLSTKLNLTIIFVLLMTANLQATGEPPLTHNLNAINPPIPGPILKLQDMDETFVDIKTMKGKIIVLNFWATWCPPCRREMTSLEELHLTTKDKNTVVLAINVGEELEEVFSFINSIEPSPTFQVLFDIDSLTMKRWKVVGLPTTYVINPEGNIVYKAIGGREFNHPDILKKILNLNEKPQSKDKNKT